jgi:hypothetical protein
VRHRASPKFWAHYQALPVEVRALADSKCELLKSNPRHTSLHLKRIGELWSVRVGDNHRALGLDDNEAETDGIYRVWIGTHAEYDRYIR